MEHTKQKIKIVEYNEKLAAGVAEMWNLSRDGWGGDSHVTTEEKVRTQEANSSNLNLYLAMDDETVVGYCGLSEYREDEGALYIPLLNARTDYHGRKIGKNLVLKAIERVVELGWPRLDLYTWAGNTKAVPLYKKCGFFWEDRDDTTHLMNFMPTVLTTEAVNDFFENTDWYALSTREIEVTPDGRKENDFTYYEYKWENDNQSLRMEFERTGRGLRLIETDDYLISAELENFTLVCNSEYEIRYFVKNKSGKPLQIELSGENHKLVNYSYKKVVEVNDELELKATYKLGEFEEEQSNWRTHPSVVTNLLINGKKAKFSIGLLPKLPAKLKATLPGYQSYVNVPSSFYIDIENNLTSKATFTIQIPESELLILQQPTFTVELEPKGKISVPVLYVLKDHGFYSPNLAITVRTDNGEELRFSKKIGIGFKGLGTAFSGECDDYWHIYNGLYHMYLDKLENDTIPGRLTKGTQKTIGMFPKIGKPYSSEFSKRKPSSVRYEEKKGRISLIATYESTDFPNLELQSVATLYPEGLLEQMYYVKNTNSVETETPIWLNQSIYHELYKPVFVMNNKVIEVNEQAHADYGLWDSKQLTENWLVSRYSPYLHGISWPTNCKINFETWYLYVEHDLGVIPANSIRKTEPVYHSFGAYQSWEDFRDFANKGRMDKEVIYEDLSMVTKLNKHDSVDVKFSDLKSSYFQGTVEMNHNNQTIYESSFTLENETKEINATAIVDLKPLDHVNVHYEINGMEETKNTIVFNPTNHKVVVEKINKDGHEVLEATNGCITIAAAGSFYPALFSLQLLDKEWLDTSFPILKPRSWWNPWSGGIRSGITGVTHKSFAKEKTEVTEASLFDQYGREWKGINLSIVFKENEEVKGLAIEQYYVMLPGVPVVAYCTKFIQETGKYYHYKKWFSECAFLPGKTMDSSWIKGASQDKKYLAGHTEYKTELENHVLIGSKDDQRILQIITDRESIDVESYVNKEILSLAIWREFHLAQGEQYLSSPTFFVGHESILSENEVKQLQRLTFKEGYYENH
ncbi:GNAT family N-acetyltransferase [Bacillus suaedaesalsae]|uniref:GNAT family N-acetyltransferase n=1 Tax=Bacillus suaedaesalsae TaxID=2810349 RepID=A0ABS2DMQ4_9BACI|nr:GNAT family N-acetyltransferase [Bacillus suaedaesalsae]MBM6619335.1 GNAT family N-acetyltransferase [Bacillus suaedaesalsae]